MIHLLYVPFTGLGNFSGYRGDTWLKHRIEIFIRFVVPSLTAQTNKNFLLWISWRPEEEENPLVKKLQKTLSCIRGLKVMHTFGGLCFWDDKYNDQEASERLLQNLARTLPRLKVVIEDAEYVLMTIQPSDDMYLPEAVEKIQNIFKILIKDKSKKYAIGWKQGYIMNYGTKEIAEYISEGWKTDKISTYHTNTIPPFFTLVFPKEEFINPKRHYEYSGPYKSHEYVINYFTYYDIGGRGFIVGIHGSNISTVYTHRYKGKVISQGEKDMLLMRMHIYFSDPYFIQHNVRLALRSIFNRLPFQEAIRNVYKKLPPNYQKL